MIKNLTRLHLALNKFLMKSYFTQSMNLKQYILDLLVDLLLASKRNLIGKEPLLNLNNNYSCKNCINQKIFHISKERSLQILIMKIKEILVK